MRPSSIPLLPVSNLYPFLTGVTIVCTFYAGTRSRETGISTHTLFADSCVTAKNTVIYARATDSSQFICHEATGKTFGAPILGIASLTVIWAAVALKVLHSVSRNANTAGLRC